MHQFKTKTEKKKPQQNNQTKQGKFYKEYTFKSRQANQPPIEKSVNISYETEKEKSQLQLNESANIDHENISEQFTLLSQRYYQLEESYQKQLKEEKFANEDLVKHLEEELRRETQSQQKQINKFKAEISQLKDENQKLKQQQQKKIENKSNETEKNKLILHYEKQIENLLNENYQQKTNQDQLKRQNIELNKQIQLLNSKLTEYNQNNKIERLKQVQPEIIENNEEADPIILPPQQSKLPEINYQNNFKQFLPTEIEKLNKSLNSKELFAKHEKLTKLFNNYLQQMIGSINKSEDNLRKYQSQQSQQKQKISKNQVKNQ